jgi:hypothetical protein
MHPNHNKSYHNFSFIIEIFVLFFFFSLTLKFVAILLTFGASGLPILAVKIIKIFTSKIFLAWKLFAMIVSKFSLRFKLCQWR